VSAPAGRRRSTNTDQGRRRRVVFFTEALDAVVDALARRRNVTYSALVAQLVAEGVGRVDLA
jgi:hypothetical protein